jgi:hypothetical protein
MLFVDCIYLLSSSWPEGTLSWYRCGAQHSRNALSVSPVLTLIINSIITILNHMLKLSVYLLVFHILQQRFDPVETYADCLIASTLMPDLNLTRRNSQQTAGFCCFARSLLRSIIRLNLISVDSRSSQCKQTYAKRILSLHHLRLQARSVDPDVSDHETDSPIQVTRRTGKTVKKETDEAGS